MASTPALPSVVSGTINLQSTNPTRSYNGPSLYGYPYEFQVDLTIIVNANSDYTSPTSSQFDATTITVGQWLLQNTGSAFLIVAINSITNPSLLSLTLRDVDMFNALSDSTQQGNNYPSEGVQCVIFSLSPEGTAVIANTTIMNLGIGNWLNDALGRFAYRNFIETFYNFDINNSTIDYSSYEVGQIVYIGQVGGTGPYCFIPIDSAIETEVTKAFGVVSSVNQPELGNIYVRPFGKIITTLPFSLPGNIGDVLYYDSTITPSHTTNIQPTLNPIPLYIKISDNVASVLYGSIALTGDGFVPGGGGGSGTPGTQITGDNGAPTTIPTSVVGDFYIDYETGNMYRRSI